MARSPRTSAVSLRPLRAEDAEDVVRWRNKEDVASQLFSTPPTLAQHLTWFEAYSTRDDRREYVIVSGENETPVGTVGLSSIDRQSHRAELSILIGEDAARGQGLASKALASLLSIAFSELCLHRVYLQVLASNTRAIRLYERTGFVHEGTLRSHYVRDGVAHDVVVMGILSNDRT